MMPWTVYAILGDMQMQMIHPLPESIITWRASPVVCLKFKPALGLFQADSIKLDLSTELLFSAPPCKPF